MANSTIPTPVTPATALEDHDLKSRYATACRDDILIDVHYNLDYLRAALNSEDVFTTLGFGLSNFVGHTQDLLNLAEMRE